MRKGSIKFFQKAKGFGFITPDDGKEEIFLPAAVLSTEDASKLRPGTRVAFEQVAESKGPKAVSLKLLDEPPSSSANDILQARLTVLYDPSAPASDQVLDELKAQDCQVRLVNYIASPPAQDELKRLSLILSGSAQSLVRRHDPLFLALQLDDRFIPENEFWTAVSQHPALINGPVLVTAGRASVCKTKNEVRAFMGLSLPKEDRKPKTISSRLAAMIKGQVPPEAPSLRAGAPEPPKTPAEPKRTKPAATLKPKKAAAKPPKAKAAKKAARRAAKQPQKSAKKKR